MIGMKPVNETVMNHDPPVDPIHLGGLRSPEHDRLIQLLEHLHEMLLKRNDAPLLHADLDELDDLAHREIGIEEALLKRFRSSEWPAHHHEHEMLLEKLRTFQQIIRDDGWNKDERGDLYDFLSEWLVHALSER